VAPRMVWWLTRRLHERGELRASTRGASAGLREGQTGAGERARLEATSGASPHLTRRRVPLAV